MRGVNRVMLIGNLGKDPDVQFLEGNIAVAKFPLATTETYKDRAGKLISQTEGNKKFATEIVGDNLIMLDKRNDGGGFHPQGPGGHDAPPEPYAGPELPPLGDETTPGLPF